jgi:DNA-binding NarL/FixJ family response regulator
LRIVLVGHDPLARSGLRARLGEAPGLTVVLEVDSEAEVATAAAAALGRTILWDLGPERAPALDQLARAAAETSLPIVALAAETVRAPAVLAAGARGVLPRDASPRQIRAALAAAEQGLTVVAADGSHGGPPGGLLAGGAPDGTEEPIESLTPREREVLRLLAEGLPNKLIADRLGVSENTAKFHVNSILGKLGAESRTEAVVRAARLGLVAL